MGFYHHCIFPHLLDAAMTNRVLREPRRRTLAAASGRILEIGFGTGANLPHYPPSVERIEALDPDAELDRFSQPRIAQAKIAVDFHHRNAERLPSESNQFDTVVCTLTLCSIPEVGHALAEVRRVLKPGGQLLFLEHGLSPEPGVARWQKWLTPLQRRVGGGCHLDREPLRLLNAAGLQMREARQYYLPRVPRFLGYMTQGSATKV